MTDKIGYELADGTMSTDYKVGDTFEVVANTYSSSNVEIGWTITLTKADGTGCPIFDENIDRRSCCYWSELKATPETLNRVNGDSNPVKTPRQILEAALMQVYETHGIVISDLDVYWIDTNTLGVGGYKVRDIEIAGKGV